MLYRLLSLFIFTAILTLSVACGGGDAEDKVAEAAPTPTEVSISVKNYQQGQVSAIQTQAAEQRTVTKVSPTATPVPPTPSSPSDSSTNASDPIIELKISDVPATLPDYNRNDWKHWLDEDGDCQNTRHEVLIHESVIDVTFKDDRNCQVALGQWHDPYTNDTVTDATKLDVDHMVPLKNAHDSGGWAWDKKRKSEYANFVQYEDHLIAVTASANRKKGAKGPDEWKPTNKEHWCDYAIDWIEIKVQWDLSATKSEWSDLQEMIRTCEKPLSITPVASQMKAPTPEPITKPASVKPTEVSKSGSLMNVQITALDCKGKPETVVITNAGDSQQDMTGWTIVDEGAKHTFNFPNGFILDPGLAVEVVSGTLGDNTNSKLYWKKQTVWNNDGDTASILDSTGRILGTMDCP